MLPTRPRPSDGRRSGRSPGFGHGPVTGLLQLLRCPAPRLPQAVILAAGRGSRLGPIGRELPKCLLDVGGQRLIDHQIASLRDAGIERVLVVAGFEHGQVESAVCGRAEVVVNPVWGETNSLASFLLAAPWVQGDLVVLNGDVLCHPAVFRRLASTCASALAYDSTSGCDPEHMKIVHDRGRLIGMAKHMLAGRVAGENLGVLRLGRGVAQAVFEAGADLVGRGRERAWLAEAITAVAPKHPIRCLDMADLPWIEIDFPTDLARARAEVWPSIRARTPSDDALHRAPGAQWANAHLVTRQAIRVIADETLRD